MSKDVPIAENAYLFDANQVSENIGTYVKLLRDRLKEDESLRAYVLLANGGVISAVYFGYLNPNFIIVEGTISLADDEGNNSAEPVTALVAYTGIQIIFKTVKKEKGLDFSCFDTVPVTPNP